MNDAHIEAGFENNLAEQLAESLWREHWRSLNPVIFPTCHLLSNVIVERMRRAGIPQYMIKRVIGS